MEKRNQISVAWGDGRTELFLSIEGNTPEVLDYEFDTTALHKRCGGAMTYQSMTGLSGSGYFTHLGELLQVGQYRIDTVHQDFIEFETIGKIVSNNKEVSVEVALPYATHTEDKSAILQDWPTVVKFSNKVVFCDLFENFLEVITDILSGDDLQGLCAHRRAHRTLKKTFSRPDGQEEEVAVEFYNLSSATNRFSPWTFIQDDLVAYQINGESERIFQLLHIEKLQDGAFAKTYRFGGWRVFLGERLDNNPLAGGELTAGWQRIEPGVLARHYNNGETHLVSYAPAKEAYEKVAGRLARRMHEGDEFISFITSPSSEGEYIEFEQKVPKALFLLKKGSLIKEVRRGLARKVRQDIAYLATQWTESTVDNKDLLEAIPDDLIIREEDSLMAGNCQPGTEAFASEHFPGRTEVQAWELKRLADRYDVMRVLRYVATTGGYLNPRQQAS